MKKVVIAIVAIVLVACSGEKTTEQIKSEIKKYKEAIATHEEAINDLHRTIDSLNLLVGEGEEKRFAVLVEVKELQHEVFNHFFQVSGVIEAKNRSFISPQMSGQIEKIYVKEGQQVEKGELLVSLNSSVIANSIQEVKTGLEMNKILYEKQKNLWDQKIGSEIEYLQAKTNMESMENKLNTLYAQLDMAKIKAPFAGVVDDILSKVGEIANPGFELVRLVNLKELEINSDVSEAYLPYINKGDKAQVNFPNNPGFKAREYSITRTGDIINPNNRAFKVQIDLQNEGGRLKPNSICVLHLNDYRNENAIIVPSVIVKKDVSGNSFLFVLQDSEKGAVAKKVFVKAGKSYQDKTEILEGLKVGDKVIVKGFSQVSDGVAIKIK